jgi:hypothetical protein
MSLVTRTPLALEIGHRTLTNRVNFDAVCPLEEILTHQVPLPATPICFQSGIKSDEDTMTFTR